MAKFLLSFICTILFVAAIAACHKDKDLPAEQVAPQTSPADSAKIALETALASIRETNHPKTDYFTKTGMASYYADRFHGLKTASGQRYDTAAFTAAHRWLPFGSTIAVTNEANGRTILVRINDRGPHHKSRLIDLSKAAAKALGIYKKGVAKVKIEAQVAKKSSPTR